MITIADVITNCELSYQIHDKKPLSIKEAAQHMIDKYNPAPDSHVGLLLTSLVEATSPRIYLNAATLKLRYLEESVFVEEVSA